MKDVALAMDPKNGLVMQSYFGRNNKAALEEAIWHWDEFNSAFVQPISEALDCLTERGFYPRSTDVSLEEIGRIRFSF